MNNQQPFTGTVFPQIIAGGDYIFFAQKRGDYLREGDNLREANIVCYLLLKLPL